jgi:hypothetical protein
MGTLPGFVEGNASASVGVGRGGEDGYRDHSRFPKEGILGPLSCKIALGVDPVRFSGHRLWTHVVSAGRTGGVATLKGGHVP